MSVDKKGREGRKEGEEESTKEWEPRLVGFLCNWCSYAGADLAGSSRMSYPANIRIIRVPCSARVDPMFIVKSLQFGVDGILVAGCHPGDCHYSEGNFRTRRRFTALKRLLDFLGIDSRRLVTSWVSASEGAKFVQVVRDMTEEIRALGPNKRATIKSEK